MRLAGLLAVLALRAALDPGTGGASAGSTGCPAVGVYTASDLGPGRFKIACGTRNGADGIATFYPVDEPPTCAE